MLTESAIQNRIKILSADADIIAAVKDVEQKPMTTKGHYGNYMTILSAFAPNKVLFHIMVESLIGAGANAYGVQYAALILTGQ